MTSLSTRILLAVILLTTPLLGGCNYDTHPTVAGTVSESGLTPNETGPGGSGSVHTFKLHSGGPGAPRSTTAPAPAPAPAHAEHH